VCENNINYIFKFLCWDVSLNSYDVKFKWLKDYDCVHQLKFLVERDYFCLFLYFKNILF